MTPLAERDLASFLEEQRGKDLVRFITCGSVDDGKSTLVGRMLFESKNIFDDQLRTLESDSEQFGTQDGQIDLALLVDGLQAEREQGITIDVAYRFFSTRERRFIVADTPGHEQYTRNMATGASTADLAVILIDARKGVLTQTRRHSQIVTMMGIRHVVLAINKMDAINYDETAYERICADYSVVAAGCGFLSLEAIPISALRGDNFRAKSTAMPWYGGPTLMDYLDHVEVGVEPGRSAFRLPVQLVNRPNPDFRGYCGNIAEGEVRPGDRVRSMPSGTESRVKEIFIGDRNVDYAIRGHAVMLTLVDELDASRGDVLIAEDSPLEVADQFEARVLWMSDRPMFAGRPYTMKIHHKEVTASVTEIKFAVDVNSGAHLAAKSLGLNEIALVNVSTSQPVVMEPYRLNRRLGGFILIDKLTFETVGAGMIEFALRRSSNIHWQTLAVDKPARAVQKSQRPSCIWFTGLSGSGKSTIANLLEKKLNAAGKHTYLLDGDNIRHGLNRDLGFAEADRVENIRRVAEVAKLMVDAGLIVLVAFISPFQSERQMARALFDSGEFIEVFVDTPLSECEHRDPKGLYKKARRGEIANFTGIDSAYEPPLDPEIHLHTIGISDAECADQIALRVR